MAPGKVENFLGALEAEIDLLKAAHKVLPDVRTTYIGRRNSHVLGPSHWVRLIDILEKGFRFLPGNEVSVEANPDRRRELISCGKSGG